VYTPEGVYDGSLDGGQKVSFVLDRQPRPLEQFAQRFYKPGLADELRRGVRPSAPKSTPPPGLAIDPPAVPAPQDRDLALRITLAGAGLSAEDLRLYQNGVPVQDGGDFQRLAGPGRFQARVRLRSGVNRFYAMARRHDDVDARSPDVEVRFDGPDDPGRLHILALGVQKYTRHALRFSDRDAIQLAEFLHRYGVWEGGQPGIQVVLTNDAVTEKNVEDAFIKIRRAARRRPQDAVVVFLAGHTDVVPGPSGGEQFSLLLSKFPFPEDAPRLAALRGPGLAGGAGPVPPKGVVLPFQVIYRNFFGLDALQRLVILDACQADAIFDDRGVQRIQRAIEAEAHVTRTSYLLAARRGEPAPEPAVLQHGLLTYVLLRGMRAPGLRPLPVELPIFQDLPGADRDGDGVITTQELRDYTESVLPELAGKLPGLSRQVNPVGAAPRPVPPQALHLQEANADSFRLVRLPAEDAPAPP
jgi:hypothetical protein